MSLPANLVTNEVKDRAGTEVEFLFREEVGRSREYMKSGEVPSLPYRLKVQHREVGKGASLIRQSNVTILGTLLSQVDLITPVQVRESRTLYVPQGHLTDLNVVKDIAAFMNSFCATLGAGTTVLYDGTGYGSAALINGTL
jgi:hypothetical protein